jgi:Ca2+-binding EF-hand superfamily protein
VVELRRKAGESWGMTIMSTNAENEPGTFVNAVKPNTPASASPMLQHGYRIIQINGDDNCSFQRVLAALKDNRGKAKTMVKLVVMPPRLMPALDTKEKEPNGGIAGGDGADSMLASATNFTDTEVGYLKAQYDRLQSESRSGKVDKNTLSACLCPPFPASLVAAIFHAMDADGDGVVDAREFITGIAACCRSPNDDSKLAFCYDAFDTNHDGRLSADEMTIMLRSLWWVNKGNAQGQGQKQGQGQGQGQGKGSGAGSMGSALASAVESGSGGDDGDDGGGGLPPPQATTAVLGRRNSSTGLSSVMGVDERRAFEAGVAEVVESAMCDFGEVGQDGRRYIVRSRFVRWAARHPLCLEFTERVGRVASVQVRRAERRACRLKR